MWRPISTTKQIAQWVGDDHSLDKILTRPVTVRAVRSLDLRGARVADVEYHIASQELSFTASEQDFAYEIRFEHAEASGADTAPR